MPIPNTVADLNATAALNSPTGSESPTQGDDFIRAHASIIRQVSDTAATADTTLRADVADTVSTTKGSGQVGFAYALAYGAGTLGKWLKDLANSAGASFVGFIQAGTGAVLQTIQEALRERVSITQFGGAPGSGDNTAAMNAAITYLGTLGGGTVLIPRVGEWRMNVVVAAENITIKMVGGRSEYDVNCIRPYSIASPAITWGDDTNVYRYGALIDCHISGTDSTAGGVTEYAKNAPQALLLKGGVVNFMAFRCVIYNGKQSVALVPSATQPVTGVTFLGGTIRNDLTDSANARTIYGIRKADPGYWTSNKWIGVKLNGPTLGYLAEFDGTIDGITAEFNDCYADTKPDKGILLKGGSVIVCHNLQLDPGTTGAVVIETNQGGDPTRYIVGNMRHGGQKIRTTAGTYDLPAEADTFGYRPRFIQAYLGDKTYFTAATDPYNTTNAPYVEPVSATGPLGLYFASLRIATAGKGLEVAAATNGRIGASTMVGGTITVGNTSVTANTQIQLTRSTSSGTVGHLSTTRVNGTSFTINSSSGTDTSTVEWHLVERV